MVQKPKESEKPWDYKPFLKWYSKNWLNGSIRFECTPEERSVFVDLCSMANESRNRGVIQANSTHPYPHSYIANQLNIPLELLERCLRKFEQQERIYENQQGIIIIKFSYYQGMGVLNRGRPRKKPVEQLPLETHSHWAGELNPEAQKLWNKALVELEKETNRPNFDSWFRKSVGVDYDGSRLIIGLLTEFQAEYVENNCSELVEKILAGITLKDVEVEFQIVSPNSFVVKSNV
jgi:hypothetical protein